MTDSDSLRYSNMSTNSSVSNNNSVVTAISSQAYSSGFGHILNGTFLNRYSSSEPFPYLLRTTESFLFAFFNQPYDVLNYTYLFGTANRNNTTVGNSSANSFINNSRNSLTFPFSHAE